jgi:mannose-6-phosphate isomerase
MELTCAVQSYEWGKVGGDSEVAQLRSSADADFVVRPDLPYAELWMGTHPNGPSVLVESGEPLKNHIAADPKVLGEKSRDRFGDDLPFLFKVLSVGKALSIQAHPDIELAKKLHAERPDIYKDPNHKPEMAIALTKFEGLCGFRPLPEIQENIRGNEELNAVIGKELCEALCSSDASNYSDSLKNAFSALMSVKKNDLEKPLNRLKDTIIAKSSKDSLDELFLRLFNQYPGDVGCLVIYFVNHVCLEPGQAMFLGPNLIHAYLSGDCIECMACSDNVVRAGLTPKLIDVPTLCSMLEYKCLEGGNQDVIFQCKEETHNTTLYDPPVPDFAVAKISLNEKVSLPVRDSASIVLFVRGNGKLSSDGKVVEFKRGTVAFVPAGKATEMTSEGEGVVQAFQAFC